MEQLERARQFEEQRRANAKKAKKEVTEMSGEGIGHIKNFDSITKK